MKKYFMSIDQGTTSSRVVIFDIKFNAIYMLQKEFNQYFPKDGWVEHDALEIWEGVKNLIKNILKKNKIKSQQIISIGITNQRETTVLWDKKTGIPIHNAIVWQDRRTYNFCKKLKKNNLEKKVQKITGLIIDPYFSATKIRWILDNVKKTKKLIADNNLLFGTIDTWLLWNLTEKKSHLTDITNASRTMIFDLKKEQWSEELIKLLNIPKSILPKVTPNIYKFGVTKLFGNQIKIGGMAGDQQAATIGQACFKKGQSKSTYGTGCFLLMNIGKEFKLSKNKLLTTVAFKINNNKMFCYEGSIFVAGSAIQWLRDKLEFFKNSSETDKIYSKANKNEKVFVLPALTGLGAPQWQPKVRGSIIGLTRNTSKKEIVRATLDSLCFQTLDLIKAMEKDSKIKIFEMKVDGGMVHNNNFLQTLSNVLQIKINKPKNVETTSLGAAYLAALECGYIKNIEEINKNWKSKKIYKNKITKKIIDKEINVWKKTIEKIIKLYS